MADQQAPQTLAQRVRTKYPGAYDDLTDQQLEAQVKAKFPGAYDDVPTTPSKPAAAVSTQESEQPGTVERFGKALFQNTLMPVVDLGLGVANAVAHPLDTYLGLKSSSQAVADLAKAQWDQAVKAAQKAKAAGVAAKGGDVASASLSAEEALGHGLAAVLPILGPAAAKAGEAGASGDVAGMAGGATGLLAPFVASKVIESRHAPNPARAAILERQAIEDVAGKVLAPGNPRYKAVAQRIAPEVMERGLTGDRSVLQQVAEDGLAEASARIDAATARNPGELVSFKGVIKRLNEEIARERPTGETVPGFESRVSALRTYRDFIVDELKTQGQGDKLPFDQAQKLRQKLDQIAAEGGVYRRADPQHPVAVQAGAAADAANELRQEIGRSRPDLLEANADYSFFRSLSDVLDPVRGRPKQTNFVPSGVTGGMTTAGAIVGADVMKGVPGGALIGSQLMPALKAYFASPARALAKATHKYALAEAIRAGNVPRVQTIVAKVLEMEPRGLDLSATVGKAAANDESDLPMPTVVRR